jgi:dihydroorotase
MTAPDRLMLRRPDDWHVHLRDGDMLAAVAGHTARVFARAIVMPNLVPPVTTAAAAEAYRERILAALPDGHGFTPLMTCYLTDHADPAGIAGGFARGAFAAGKLYPAHATTNAAFGVTDVASLHPALEAMQRIGMPLLVHGEVTDPDIDVFDREAVFIDRVLDPLCRRLPELRVVLEHITTEEAVAYVASGGPNLAATITAHHLVINRNAIFQGGIRPHLYCLPVLKREAHRQALVKAATSGNPKFFLGTDSAPHARHTKETDCGCAGIYTAHAAIELYAEAFAAAGALDKLEGFASRHGAQFYDLPANEDTITLSETAWEVPAELAFGADRLVPLRAGASVGWKLA